MKKAALTFLLAIALITASAQYKHSLGLAMGSPSGISYKTFTSNTNAWDLTLGGLGSYLSFTAMYEIHKPINTNFQWYYGPGAHLGTWNGNKYGSGAFLGVDGVIGIEFDPEIPFAFSLDLRPVFDLIGNRWDNHTHWFRWQSQLAIRYIF